MEQELNHPTIAGAAPDHWYNASVASVAAGFVVAYDTEIINNERLSFAILWGASMPLGTACRGINE